MVRPATEAELDAIVGHMEQHFFFRDRYDRQCAGRGTLLTAWAGSELLGVVYVSFEPADEPELRRRLPGVRVLTHLEVRPDLRNRGVGSLLLHGAEDVLRSRGCPRIALGVHADNTAVTRLYLRHGYRPWPHEYLKTVREEYRVNGTMIQVPDECMVYFKNLD
ncbi:hypothetical protein Lfu02_67890 [Longispora fulva]|nr:hypothetical protein Lfu02_67890 [Longispora fulva]